MFKILLHLCHTQFRVKFWKTYNCFMTIGHSRIVIKTDGANIRDRGIITDITV